jgi:WhiB family redox-sensing transcriptional regulator
VIDPRGDTSWKTEGKCYDLVHTVQDYVVWESFFGDTVDERRPALDFCEECPVQQRCLQFALESPELWGVWGGRDESEIRRDLWVNSNGTIGGRARWPRCPWCKEAPETLTVTDHLHHEITCTGCGFKWRSETTRMGVEENERTRPPD